MVRKDLSEEAMLQLEDETEQPCELKERGQNFPGRGSSKGRAREQESLLCWGTEELRVAGESQRGRQGPDHAGSCGPW